MHAMNGKKVYFIALPYGGLFEAESPHHTTTTIARLSPHQSRTTAHG